MVVCDATLLFLMAVAVMGEKFVHAKIVLTAQDQTNLVSVWDNSTRDVPFCHFGESVLGEITSVHVHCVFDQWYAETCPATLTILAHLRVLAATCIQSTFCIQHWCILGIKGKPLCEDSWANWVNCCASTIHDADLQCKRSDSLLGWFVQFPKKNNCISPWLWLLRGNFDGLWGFPRPGLSLEVSQILYLQVYQCWRQKRKHQVSQCIPGNW